MMDVQYRLRLPPDPRAAAVARRFVRCLEDDVDAAGVDSLELLVTELVTNSVRHAGLSRQSWIDVEVVAGGGHVRVEVTDPGRGFDPASIPAPTESMGSGWGLYLVQQLAHRWGIHHDAVTRVWFELPASSETSPAGALA